MSHEHSQNSPKQASASPNMRASVAAMFATATSPMESEHHRPRAISEHPHQEIRPVTRLSVATAAEAGVAGGGGAAAPPTAANGASVAEMLVVNDAADAGWEWDANVGRERKQTRIRAASQSTRLLADTGANKFHFKRFAQQLLYHLFTPFTIPFHYCIEGKIMCQNQTFISRPDREFRKQLGGHIFSNMGPSLFYFLITMRYILQPMGYVDLEELSDVEVLVAIFGYIAHRLVVATKYALLTDEYYEGLHKTAVSGDRHRQLELLTGWSAPGVEVCDRELRLSARRLGINLDRVMIEVNPPDTEHVCPEIAARRKIALAAGSVGDDWALPLNATVDPMDAVEKASSIARAKQSASPSVASELELPTSAPDIVVDVGTSEEKSGDGLRNRDGKKAIGSISRDIKDFYKSTGGTQQCSAADNNRIKMSALFLATRLVREVVVFADKAKMTWGMPALTGLIQAFLGIVIRGFDGRPALGGTGWAPIISCLACFILTFLFCTVLSGFIQVGCADYYRRYALFKVLGVMMNPNGSGKELTELGVAFQPWFIDFTVPGNIPAWFALRQILQDFGGNYRARIQAYTSYALLVALSLLGVLFYELFTGRAGGDVVLVVSVTFNALVIFLLIANMIYYGSLANQQYEVHQAYILDTQFAIRQLLADSNPFISSGVQMNVNVEYETLRRCERLIESVLKCMQVSHETNPVTILGIRASDTLVRSLLGSALTGIGTGARVIYNNSLAA